MGDPVAEPLLEVLHAGREQEGGSFPCEKVANAPRAEVCDQRRVERVAHLAELRSQQAEHRPLPIDRRPQQADVPVPPVARDPSGVVGATSKLRGPVLHPQLNRGVEALVEVSDQVTSHVRSLGPVKVGAKCLARSSAHVIRGLLGKMQNALGDAVVRKTARPRPQVPVDLAPRRRVRESDVYPRQPREQPHERDCPTQRRSRLRVP